MLMALLGSTLSLFCCLIVLILDQEKCTSYVLPPTPGSIFPEMAGLRTPLKSLGFRTKQFVTTFCSDRHMTKHDIGKVRNDGYAFFR